MPQGSKKMASKAKARGEAPARAGGVVLVWVLGRRSIGCQLIRPVRVDGVESRKKQLRFVCTVP